MITQEKLKNILTYDKITGLFYRKASNSIAGSFDTRGYVRIYAGSKTYLAHRLVWLYIYGEFPTAGIDHINGIVGDNRIDNLRSADQFTNQKNRKVNKNNKSGCMGVYGQSNGSWVVTIKIKNKSHYLGTFTDIQKAIKARKEAEVNHGFHDNHGRITKKLKDLI
tara:strand:+ start:150 stop:644 length:495 start_codon:yes stop_codon:yes gene_type:complete